jgi:LacI family transcriptional regulator
MKSQAKASKVVTHALEALRTRISSSEYKPGSTLPSEIGLAVELKVSRATIRNAIDVLVASGEVRRQKHSRPIVQGRAVALGTVRVPEIPIWVSRPMADGTTLSFLRGVSRGLIGTNYRIVVREPRRFTGQAVQSDERQFLEDLLADKNYAGAIIWRDAFADNDDLLRKLSDLGKPLIFVDTPPPNAVNGDYIASANALAARRCVEHLIELGHSRIVFIADSDVPETVRERIRGYWRAMKSAGIEELGKVVVASRVKPQQASNMVIASSTARHPNLGSYFRDLAYGAAQAILAMDPPPTAIFASHDILAVSLRTVLSGLGVRIPEDISLVGFDWDAQCEKGFPDDLTTAAQSFEGFGAHAANLFLDRVQGEISAVNRYILLDAPLVVRSSTASDLSVPVFEPARPFATSLP